MVTGSFFVCVGITGKCWLRAIPPVALVEIL